MTAQPNDVAGARGRAAQSAQRVEAKGRTQQAGERARPVALVSNRTRARVATARHAIIDSSPPTPQPARRNRRPQTPVGRGTALQHERKASLGQKAPNIRILLVTQPGLIADGLARSLAQIAKAAQVTVSDAAEDSVTIPLPTLVVLDVDGALSSPAELVARFVRRFPSTPIVAMGSTLDESLMTTSIRSGAKAYLPKTYSEWQAVGVLRVVLQGAGDGTESTDETLHESPSVDDHSTPRRDGRPYGLTRAEIEVLSLLCEGLTSFEIAKLRGGKEGTIKAHLHNIYPKLGVPNRLGASRIGQRIDEVQQCQLARASDQASVRGWLLPHMKLEHKKKGELLFHKGDPARTLYFIQQGRIALPEIGVEMSDGELFGEIGIFTPAHTRSFTARCETDANLFCLGADEATRLFFEHPQFAYHVMQLMARRLQADSTRTR